MIKTVISILAFILIIGILIFIHELGHFLAAKKNGVGVVEFSIGFGPKMFSFVRKGTRYSVKWIPFGGYCMMLGDETFLVGDTASEAAGEGTVVNDDEHAFSKKSVWVRIAVIAAGPVFNFILALVLAVLLTAMVGATTTKLGSVAEDYPAVEAGLQAGDEITKLDHTSVHLFKEITLYMAMHSGETLNVTYVRDGKTYETTLVPKWSAEENRYLIGITSAGRQENLAFFDVLKYGWYEFGYNTGAVIKSLGMLFTGKASFNDLSGPIGMAGMVNDIVDAVDQDTEGESFWTKFYWTFVNLLSFMTLISANLGVMNLLPIPGMDGGRLIFLFIEAIRGKPIEKKKEGIVTLIGFGILILIMVAVFFNDIRKVFFHV